MEENLNFWFELIAISLLLSISINVHRMFSFSKKEG